MLPCHLERQIMEDESAIETSDFKARYAQEQVVI
jgi:hypothetical protein